VNITNKIGKENIETWFHMLNGSNERTVKL